MQAHLTSLQDLIVRDAPLHNELLQESHSLNQILLTEVFLHISLLIRTHIPI